jgi:hypothetical protein
MKSKTPKRVERIVVMVNLLQLHKLCPERVSPEFLHLLPERHQQLEAGPLNLRQPGEGADLQWRVDPLRHDRRQVHGAGTPE